MHYEESSQATKWQLSSRAELKSLRERANRRVRDALSRDAGESSVADGGGADNVGSSGDVKMEDGVGGAGGGSDDPRDVYGFAATRGDRPKAMGDDVDDDDDDNDGDDSQQSQSPSMMQDESDPDYGPTRSSKSRGSHPLLTPADEMSLLSFYCSKIPLLIGPHAMLPSCRRAAKVSACACLLFRRFYLSNSVMGHDPKAILAASAFLATKVEDCMILVSYLEAALKEMNTPMTVQDILDAEVRLIKGIDFDLLVFSPYKTVLSCTEDLRTFLKTERGRGLISFPPSSSAGEEDDDAGEEGRQLAGEDLRPMHDAAMKIVDDVIVSDVSLMFAPGEVGLAALMIANEYAGGEDGNGNGGGAPKGGGGSGEGDNADDDAETPPRRGPKIDVMGYVRLRFQDAGNESEEVKVDAAAIDAVVRRVSRAGRMMRELGEGKHGCGNHGVDMDVLKGLNKKLKKCRAWGAVASSSDKKEGKKKKKKRKAEDNT